MTAQRRDLVGRGVGSWVWGAAYKLSLRMCICQPLILQCVSIENVISNAMRAQTPRASCWAGRAKAHHWTLYAPSRNGKWVLACSPDTHVDTAHSVSTHQYHFDGARTLPTANRSHSTLLSTHTFIGRVQCCVEAAHHVCVRLIFATGLRGRLLQESGGGLQRLQLRRGGGFVAISLRRWRCLPVDRAVPLGQHADFIGVGPLERLVDLELPIVPCQPAATQGPNARPGSGEGQGGGQKQLHAWGGLAWPCPCAHIPRLAWPRVHGHGLLKAPGVC